MAGALERAKQIVHAPDVGCCQKSSLRTWREKEHTFVLNPLCVTLPRRPLTRALGVCSRPPLERRTQGRPRLCPGDHREWSHCCPCIACHLAVLPRHLWLPILQNDGSSWTEPCGSLVSGFFCGGGEGKICFVSHYVVALPGLELTM